MNKKYILKKNHDIETLIKYRHSVGSRLFIIYYQYINMTKIVISVSKKIGNAVERNYQKRVLKEILRKNMDSYLGYQILVVVKAASTTLSYNEKNTEILKLINRIKVDKK